MNPARIVGLVLVPVGVVLGIIGLQATDSLADRVSDTFTGHWTDKTNFYLVGAAAAIVLGALLAVFGSKRSLSA